MEERQYGYRLTSPRDEHGHGDLGTAFSLAMVAAVELAAKKRTVVRIADEPEPGADQSPYAAAVAELQYENRLRAAEDRQIREREKLDAQTPEELRQILIRAGRMRDPEFGLFVGMMMDAGIRPPPL